MTKNYKAPSEIIDVDNYIAVVASNTGELFYFDKEAKPLLKNCRWGDDGRGYLCRCENSKTIRAHWLITGEPLKGFEVDHIDRNKFNNRNNNLRIVSRSENIANMGLNIKNTTGLKGVYYVVKLGRWQTKIRFGDKQYSLGYYKSKYDAARAYDTEKIRLYGNVAATNQSLGLLEADL